MSKLKEEIQEIEKYQDSLVKYLQDNQVDPTKLVQDGELMLFQSQTIAQVDDIIYHLSANSDGFVLHTLQFQKDPIKIKVKLLDPYSDKPIDYLQYLGDPYDFEVQSNTAILMIKQNHGKSKRPLIKAVFKATIQQNSVVFYQLSNIKHCLQVKIHPLNSNYICILGTTKEWNRSMAQEKDQVFSIYHVNNLFKPDLRINLNQYMKHSAITFVFSDSIDQNQCLVYFATTSAKLFSYNLLLNNLSISHKTMTYLKQTEFKQFSTTTFELRDKNQIILKYDKQLYNPQRPFEQIQLNPIKSLQGDCVLLLKLPYQMHLFLVVMKLDTQNLRFLLLMGEDLKSIQLVYDNHIYLDELPNIKTQDGRSQLLSKQIPYCQPILVKQQIPIIKQSDCPFDLQNRANCLMNYRNTLIHIDYSELTKLSLEPSAVQINCFNVSENEDNSVDLIQQQYCIIQCFCTEIKNRKTIIVHKIDKQNHFFINLNMQTLFNLAHKSEPIRIDANLSQAQMQQYQLHKQNLIDCRNQLLQFQNKCQTITKESELVQLNDDIMNCVKTTIFPCAKSISYEYEQMEKLLGDLKKNSEILKSSKLNSDLNKNVIENNERIYQELFHSDNLKNNGELAKLSQVKQEINDINQKYTEIRQNYLNSKTNFENLLHSQQLDKNKMGYQIHQSLIQQLTEYSEKIQYKQ